MSMENFYNHTCSIFHLENIGTNLGYGLSNSEYKYNEKADLEQIECHFYIKNTWATMIQNDPENKLIRNIKLALPLGIDIKKNDKVVDTTVDNPTNNLEFTVSFVYKVQEHHLIALLFRQDIQEVL